MLWSYAHKMYFCLKEEKRRKKKSIGKNLMPGSSKGQLLPKDNDREGDPGQVMPSPRRCQSYRAEQIVQDRGLVAESINSPRSRFATDVKDLNRGKKRWKYLRTDTKQFGQGQRGCGQA